MTRKEGKGSTTDTEGDAGTGRGRERRPVADDDQGSTRCGEVREKRGGREKEEEG
jgi:hypothetical protein